MIETVTDMFEQIGMATAAIGNIFDKTQFLNYLALVDNLKAQVLLLPIQKIRGNSEFEEHTHTLKTNINNIIEMVKEMEFTQKQKGKLN